MATSEQEPVFEFSGGRLCLDFVNTVGDRGRATSEKLTGYAALLDWGRESRSLSDDDEARLRAAARRSPGRAGAVFRRAIELRECLFRIFSSLAAGGSPSASDVARFNRHLNGALRQLEVAPGGEKLAWCWSGPPEALDRMLWPVLRSAAALLTSDACVRVRECDSETCSWLFVDRSPSGHRRWCDMKTCGNRHKARRHYRRRKAAGSGTRRRGS